MRVATMPMQGWLATPTRRNALKGIFIAPAILMLGVAVQSRPNYIDFDRMVVDSRADQKITNYISVVRATDAVTASRSKSPQDLDRVANLWIEGGDRGKLQPLQSQAIDDSIHLGVKGQILASVKALSHELYKRSKREQAAGQYAQSGESLIKALRVFQPLRYSDITSVAVIGGAQRRLLKELVLVWPKVPNEHRAELAAQLEELKPDPAKLEETVHQERKVAVVEESRLKEIAQTTGDKKALPEIDEDLPLIVRVCKNTEADDGELISRLQR